MKNLLLLAELPSGGRRLGLPAARPAASTFARYRALSGAGAMRGRAPCGSNVYHGLLWHSTFGRSSIRSCRWTE